MESLFREVDLARATRNGMKPKEEHQRTSVSSERQLEEDRALLQDRGRDYGPVFFDLWMKVVSSHMKDLFCGALECERHTSGFC